MTLGDTLEVRASEVRLTLVIFHFSRGLVQLFLFQVFVILLDLRRCWKIACLFRLKFLPSQISIWRRKVLTFIVNNMSKDVAVGLELSCAAISALHHNLGPPVDHDGISFVLTGCV